MGHSFRIIPLGGLGEIGMNMMAYEDEHSLFLIDSGVMFPDSSLYGIDYLLPDFSYLRKKNKKIAALFVTHGHEDHIGGIPFLRREFNFPIYAPLFAKELLLEKFKEHNLGAENLFPMNEQTSVRIGNFSFEFINVRHSIVDAYSIAIKTKLGTIIHTGDFKLDPYPIAGESVNLDRFGKYGKEGVFLLLSDSTNAERQGYSTSEYKITETLEDLFHKSPGRILVSVFSSNIRRIQEFINLAKAHNRKIAFDGRSMFTTTRIGQELGYLQIKSDQQINLEDIHRHPERNILIITTGSQGEPRSALVRAARGEHKHIKIKEDDTVILSSKSIPGNERAIGHLIDSLYKQGADVIYEKISNIHASGHAYEEELKMLLQLTAPKHFMPIHGEYRHLVKHAKLARICGVEQKRVIVATDGDIVEFTEEGGRIVDHFECERVFVDGMMMGTLGHPLIRERRLLSETGIVYVVLVRNEKTGEIVGGPDIFSQGFVLETELAQVLVEAKTAVIDAVKKVPLEKSDDVLQTEIRTVLRRFFRKKFEQVPIVLPMIVDF